MTVESKSNPLRTILLVSLIVVVVGVVLIFVVLGMMFGWRLIFARPTDAAAEKALFERIVARIEKQQQTPASENGWSQLEPFCAPSPDPTVVAPLKAISDLYDTDRAKRDGKLAADAAKTREIVKTFNDRVAPALTAALAKPFIIYPSDWRQGALARWPNFLQMRALVQGLCIQGQTLDADKRYGDALTAYLNALALGSRIGRQGPVITLMIGLGMQRMGVEGLADMLSRGVLSKDDNQRAVTSLKALSWDSADFVDRTDEEFVLGVQSLNLMAEGKLSSSQSAAPGLIERIFGPMIASRANILYQNYYLQIRPPMAALDFDRLAAANTAAMTELQSTPAAVVIPNSTTAMVQFLGSRTSLGACELVAALQQYRLDHGAYPQNLDALVPTYLDALPPDLMATDHKFRYQSSGTAFTLGSSSPTWEKLGLKSQIDFHPYKPLFSQK